MFCLIIEAVNCYFIKPGLFDYGGITVWGYSRFFKHLVTIKNLSSCEGSKPFGCESSVITDWLGEPNVVGLIILYCETSNKSVYVKDKSNKRFSKLVITFFASVNILACNHKTMQTTVHILMTTLHFHDSILFGYN